jgi:hypothetical protein
MKRRLVLPIAALLAGALLMLWAFPPPRAVHSAEATYSQGVLHVLITQKGAGRLLVEVLGSGDEVVGRAEHRVEGGLWREDVRLAKTLAIDDLMWYRVRYRLEPEGGQPEEETESISEILRRPVLHIVGQQSYASGGAAAVRVVVTDSNGGPIGGNGVLRIDLLTENNSARPLFTGRLNGRGTAEAQFRLPAALAGPQRIRYSAATPIGDAEFVQQVRVENPASILLTTEKPIYQPGQAIHARALALDRASRDAATGRTLTFEVEDSKGNKVFRKKTQTDRFGIASAEFPLAEEVNLGTYHLRAIMDGSQTAETALSVERYLLPKFKMAIEFAGKAKHGYRPGDHVTGTVRANYFFGKPVDNAAVEVRATSTDVSLFDAATASGKTDADGSWRFDLKLPDYFAGRPLDRGAACVIVEATVKDGAGHSESRGEPVVVSASPILITAVPEGGTLAPGLNNQVFIVTSYADGTPAQSEVTMGGRKVATDLGGVAVLAWDANGQTSPVRIEAQDKDGNRAAANVTLESRGGGDQVLLRTDRAVFRPGDRIALKLFSTRKNGAAYVDLVKDRQTVLTRDLDIVNGQAELSLDATPDLAGTLDVNAYIFGSAGRPAADHRLLFVEPADELKIEAAADASSYKPGGDARIHFRVTNAKGQGVQAALGVQVVDEAVFALAEKQPGFAKVFFYLEQEAMKPRYEIHSLDMTEAIDPVRTAQRDLAARVLFAAAESVNPNRFETEIGRTLPQTKSAEYSSRYRARLVDRLRAALAGASWSENAVTQVRDAWDMPLKLERAPWNRQYYIVRSAGPDKRFDTEDDLAAMIVVKSGHQVKNGAGRTELDVEHDRGPFNGMGEIAGSVVDQSGSPVPAMTITARDHSGRVRTTNTNEQGQFSFAGLAEGQYSVDVSAQGSPLSREVTLKARDRALVRAMLDVSATAEVVDGPVPMGRGGLMPRFAAMDRLVGGVVGGVAGALEERAMPVAMPAPPMAMRLVAAGNTVGAVATTGAVAPRVRSYFPEALYINPEIVTDGGGRASIAIPLADSITTWRMALVASTAHGALGSGTSSIKVFQDFFADLDLPLTLTQGDRVSIPVAAYNYSGADGEVRLRLEPADWYALVEDTAEKTVAVEVGRVGGAQFTIQANRIGKFKFTLRAAMGMKRGDVIVREIEVIPNGREQTTVFNGRLESSARHDVVFPAGAIPDASKIVVRAYPGPLSQIVEGMDAILRMPFGCFEQTSSATYPNVLALDYMKRIKKLTPEVHAKAEGFIVNGYQRLLTFEVPGGGFSWFGSAPANKILTAYGLMEFFDMARVHEIDPNLIRRTQQWLAGQQQADGSWKPDTQFINEGATNRYNTDVLRITAYLGWSLGNTGYQGPAVEKARQYVAGHMDGKPDPYTLAVIANFAADYGKDREFTRRAVNALLAARTEKDDLAWWDAEETAVYARGASAAVETTGLAVQALLKSGEGSSVAAKALRYIASKKDASGTWGTTQATIMVLRALLLSTEKGAADVLGTLEVTLNGRPAGSVKLTADNNDLLHQFVLPGVDAHGANQVELRFTGRGGLAYQVAGTYWMPWSQRPPGEPMTIDVTYDRTRLQQDDVATATATVKNNLPRAANLVMIDLGIPPGFDLLTEDLQALVEKTAGQKGGRLEKFNLTATQAILYFDAIAPGGAVTVKYRLRAKYPIRARTFESRVYEYYQPEAMSLARPVEMEVRKK